MNVNDNTTRRRNARLTLVSDLISVPVACHCGSRKAYADMEHGQDGRRSFFVWCADCEVEGPRAPTYDTAVMAWNQASKSLSALSHGRQPDKLH